jgi:DNA polymerase (family 10)
LNADLARKAKDLGIPLIIDSDSHSVRGLSKTEGIVQARRGWIEKKDVVNTKTWKEFERLLKD